MTPDLDLLRLRALAVPGVARLADHHDGLGPPPPHTAACAVRVFAGHVEVDIVLAPGESMTATTARLHVALSPLLAGRAVSVTVIDVEPSDVRPDAIHDRSDQWPARTDTGDTDRGKRTRAIARSVLDHLPSLEAEGLPAKDLANLTAVCRVLDAFVVDPTSEGVLIRRLRALLTAADGPTGRTLLGHLDDIDPTP